MTNYQKEQIENIRRTAERGKAQIERSYLKQEPHDCFIHILDLIQTIKNDPYYNEDFSS